METLQEIINKMNNKSKIDKINKLKFSKIDSDIQDLDYEDALIYDKRSILFKNILGLSSRFTNNFRDFFYRKSF